MDMQFRLGEQSDIAQLNALALRAKAYWGYPAAQLDVRREQLAISPVWVSMQLVHVACADGRIVAMFVILQDAENWRLEHMWVEPAVIRKGVGRALLTQALHIARGLGANELMVDSDPHAAGFYSACGGELVGALAAPIQNEPKRTLPVFRLRC